MRVGINVYTVQFKQARKQEGPKVFARNGGFDAYDFLRRYLRQHENKLQRPRTPKEVLEGATQGNAHVFTITRVDEHKDDTVLEGLVEAGEAGYAAKILDLNTEKVAHNKKTYEAETPPFYFRFFLPDGQTKGLALVQRLGRNNPRSALFAHMHRWFMLQDITCTVDPLVDSGMLEKYLQGGTVRGLVLRAWKKPEEVRPLLKKTRISGASPEEGTEFQIEVRPKGVVADLVSRVRQVAKGDRGLNSLVQVEGLPDADEASVEVQNKGLGTKKFLISRPDAGFSEDVTDAIKYENGHPTWNTIRKEARRICDEVADRLY